MAGREGGDQVSDDDDLARLRLVIERQRRELAALRGAADVTSVVAMARGMLMERSGCSAAEAAAHLAGMAAAAGLPLHEMAAVMLQRVSPASAAAPAASAAADAGHEAPSASWPLRELLALL